MRSPDSGLGITGIAYMTFPAFGGGVHSIVTVELVVPFTILLSLTSLGGGPINKIYKNNKVVLPSHFFFAHQDFAIPSSLYKIKTLHKK